MVKAPLSLLFPRLHHLAGTVQIFAQCPFSLFSQAQLLIQFGDQPLPLLQLIVQGVLLLTGAVEVVL
jgi:hypothetical protein